MPSRSTRSSLITILRSAYRAALISKQKQVPLDEVRELTAAAISRRQFIRNTGVVTAATAVGGTAFLASCSKEKPVIAIVGAGIAGLYAAYILRNAGIYAQIYESSNRTGGRIFTARNLMGTGLHTELGAEFIDSTHTDIRRLADDFNLGLMDTHIAAEQELHHAMFYFEGRVIQDKELLTMFAPFAIRIQKDIDALSDVINYQQHSDHDVQMDRISLAQYLTDIGISGVLYKLIDVAYTTEYGLDISEQSAINFLMLIDTGMTDRFRYSGFSDERYKVIGGNQSITESLSDLLEGQIFTDRQLTAIREKAAGNKVELQFSAKGGGSETILADHVIVTVPFSVLRNIDISYPISAAKRTAIAELGYGQNAKFFMGFDRKVWREQGYTGFSFSDTIAQNAWDHTQMQTGEGAGFTVFTGGEASKTMGQMDDAAFAAQSMLVLDKMYPGMEATRNAKTSRFHWPTYPHSKASYTCFKPGQYTTMEGAQSEPAGHLWFAGEHCSFEFQGFMNGAAKTGREAAEAILRAIK